MGDHIQPTNTHARQLGLGIAVELGIGSGLVCRVSQTTDHIGQSSTG